MKLAVKFEKQTISLDSLRYDEDQFQYHSCYYEFEKSITDAERAELNDDEDEV